MPKWQRFRPNEARAEVAETMLNTVTNLPAVQAVSDSINKALDNAVEAARPMVQNVAQALEPAQQIVAGAKTLMSDPLRYLSQAATKAIPAAIAASASLQYTGGQGSFSNFLYPWVVRSKYLRVDGNREAYIGKPLCKVRSLSNLSGYCKCQNVKLNLSGNALEPPATLDEQEIVVRYLEAGVFIE